MCHLQPTVPCPWQRSSKVPSDPNSVTAALCLGTDGGLGADGGLGTDGGLYRTGLTHFIPPRDFTWGEREVCSAGMEVGNGIALPPWRGVRSSAVL